MPIEKIPVVHKFGILSQSHRKDVEDKLNSLAQDEMRVQQNTTGRSNHVMDVDKLVEKINRNSNADNAVLKLQEQISSVLTRCKRKGGFSEHVTVDQSNITEAWRNLAILSTCRLKQVKEESLHILHFSLYESPLHSSQIESLFYLGRILMEPFITDLKNDKIVISDELIGAKVAYIVFMRLYYHHLIGDLRVIPQEFVDLKHVCTGIHPVYEEYPVLNTQLMIIANIIAKMTFIDDSKTSLEENNMLPSESLDNEVRNDILKSGYNQPVERINKRHIQKGSTLPDRCFVKEKIHDDYPFLWHSLHIWLSSSQNLPSISEDINGLMSCRNIVIRDSWLEHCLSLHSMQEASKSDIKLLYLFLNLPRTLSSNVSTFSSHIKRTQRTRKEPQEVAITANSCLTPTLLDDVRLFVDSQVDVSICESDDRKSTSSHEVEQHKGSSTESARITVEDCDLGFATDWPLNLMIFFIDCITGVCLNGLTSEIQTLALTGNSQCYGLIDYLSLTGDDFWSLRCAAAAGLARINCYFRDDPLRDGLRNCAWKAILRQKEIERNLKVLRAFKLAQSTCNTLEQSTTKKSNNGVFWNIAKNLSAFLIPAPPFPIKISLPKDRTKESKQNNFLSKSSPKRQQNEMIRRTTISEDVKLSASLETAQKAYDERSWDIVQNMVEDQFRKEIIEEEQLREELKKSMNLSDDKSNGNING